MIVPASAIGNGDVIPCEPIFGDAKVEFSKMHSFVTIEKEASCLASKFSKTHLRVT